jgi:host factor-I protein
VILETNNQEQLIFKHAISTVVVSRPVYGSPVVHPVSAAAGAPAPAAGGEPAEV